MQAIFEPLFSISYLIIITILGVKLIKNSTNNKEILLFGIMAIVLGFGDSFHVLSRAYALITNSLDDLNVVAIMGVGKLITSITMTIFYLILYYIFKLRFKIKTSKILDFVIWILVISRIVLCLFPQNDWTSINAPVEWGIYRNIPFLIFGLLNISMIYFYAHKEKDMYFKLIALFVLLSFAFYTPVVLFASEYNWVGMLMIPKTIAYIFIVYVGYRAYKK